MPIDTRNASSASAGSRYVAGADATKEEWYRFGWTSMIDELINK
jgi:hypothetical protein